MEDFIGFTFESKVMDFKEIELYKLCLDKASIE